MRTTISFNDKDLRAGVDALRKKFPQAVRRAVKRATTAGEVALARAMVEDTALPVRKIRDAMTVKIDGDGLTGTIEAKGKRIPLIDFKARGPEPSRGKGRGVTYVLPGGRQRLEHAFIATMPNTGHRGVFERTGRYRARPARKTGKMQIREQIRERFGPSIVHVFMKFLPVAAARAQEQLVTSLRSEINYALSRQ